MMSEPALKKTGLQGILKGDKAIWFVVGLLSLISIVAVYSATGSLAYAKQGGNTEHYLIKHMGLVITGLCLLYITHNIDFKWFSRMGQLALYISVPLLAFTLLTGSKINDANRWLTVPIINATFQTSDLAKLALIMYIARLLHKKQDQIKDFKSAFLPLVIPVIVVCGLIFPANFSTAAILFATCMLLLFAGRVNLKHLLAMLLIGLVASSLFILVVMNFDLPGRVGTWKARIENFVSGSSEENYQAEQAKIALANGGIIGLGPGNSHQRNFLPQAYSDFIYAIIIEEYGFLGGFAILSLYLWLFFRVVRIIQYCDNSFALFLAFGCALLLTFQAMINMAVAVNLFPVTGQALPLLSMGGTSVWFTSISIGIILSISRYCQKQKAELSHA